ncbi:MAG: LL-diaminopimelate aminotransferase [Eubacteriales bacterium]
MKVNANYNNLEKSYLFFTIAKKIREYTEANPDAKIIRLGIGDVTQPLPASVITALHSAVDDMSKAETFMGYGPEQGYDFLREALQGYYAKKNVALEQDEIFVSDGAKSDVGNILDIFSVDNTVLIPNPVYPVYQDTNVMAGRNRIYMDATAENNFLAMPDDSVDADIIYLCSPNNPTGAVYNREQLQAWVNYANKKNAVILFDSAYEIFVHDEDMPTSIFQIEGARTCAIEISSLSKTAGFTGTRCGYTVVPKELVRDDCSLNTMWLRRQTTKFNGVPYIVQKGAAAVFTEEGQAEIKANIAYYMENAAIMAKTLRKMGIWFVGGENSPYIWFQCPNGMDSWSFFDKLLTEANVVGTPGVGFGSNGEGFFRLTAFGDRDNVIEAMTRFEKLEF